MMLLWLSFLLIEGISCLPPQDDGSRPLGHHSTWPYLTSPYFGHNQYRQSDQIPSGQAGVSGGYSNYPGLDQSGDTNMAGSGEGHFWAQRYNPGPYGDVSAVSTGNGDPYEFVEESWSSGPIHEEDESFLTDMSGHKPVFSLNAHSNYHHQRKVVTQAQFTPKGSLRFSGPVYRHTNEPDAPIKDGFK